MTEKQRRFSLESLYSDVMESDLKREDLKPFILNQAPNLPVPISFTGIAI